MRIVALALLASALCAGEVEKGVYKDAFFNLTFAPPGLKKTIGTTTMDQLFRGTSRGGIKVSISVHESKEPRDGAAWLAAARAGWQKKKRKLENVAVDGARIVFTEKRLGVFDAHHGHAFYTRGSLCFEVHAWIEDKTSTSAADIDAALKALKLGPDRGCGILALRIARHKNLQPDDPAVLLAAGAHYLKGDLLGNQNDALAAALLARARRELKPDALDKNQRWRLHHLGGEAHLRVRKAKEAAQWFAQAVELAPKANAGAMHYGCARAHAAAGDLDAAFAALDKAFAGGHAVSRAELSHSKALAPLRKDARWEAFWKKHVERR